MYDELKDNYYKYPAQLPPLAWLNDEVPPAPEEILAEREGDELKLSWQKPGQVKDVLTYTVYYSLSDSIDPTLAKNILLTGIRDTSVYLPVDTVSERGYTFSVSALPAIISKASLPGKPIITFPNFLNKKRAHFARILYLWNVFE